MTRKCGDFSAVLGPVTTPKAVMPGQSRPFYADCANLPAMPGIHVLAAATKNVDGRGIHTKTRFAL
jgi:hypothetical protein